MEIKKNSRAQKRFLRENSCIFLPTTMKFLQMEQIVYHVFGFLKINLKRKAILCQVCKEWQRLFTKTNFLHLIHWSFSICESFRTQEHDLDPNILIELARVPYLSNLEITYNNSRADYLKPI